MLILVTSTSGGPNPPMPDKRYLLLVNTAISSMLDKSKLRQFDQSPYDGLAVAFLHAYDIAPVPSAASVAATIKEWRNSSSKDIWPWIYLNRMIGYNAAENNFRADNPYFRRFAGLDLENKSGARADFLNLWRNYLAAARETHVPGIVCDLEFYNHYKLYDIGELARISGKSPAETAAGLQALGAEMAEIANEAYPDATLWLLFTGFTHPAHKTIQGVPYFPSPTYIAIGLLDEISRKHLGVKVLSGGEGSLAYCHSSLSQLREAILKRQSDFASPLAKYGESLELAGTMTLWSDRSAARGFISEGDCKDASAQNVEQLQPYLELLLRSYRYNWIYASSDGNYLAFSKESAPRFDAVIRGALARTAANR